jgi:hypothetical protein
MARFPDASGKVVIGTVDDLLRSYREPIDERAQSA